MVSSALSRLVNLQRHFQVPKGSDDNLCIGMVKLTPDVSEALSRGRAVVALESTIISHGLSAEELERLANLGTKARKTARRDIAHVVSSTLKLSTNAHVECTNVATKGDGATTVSATMIFASMVGIPVFVTGGIGGVHRHGENTMDVSSDLTELGRTPVAVISAGVKSILDIPRTLEHLETQGVCVAAYKTNEFPAFFTETSGCKAPCRVDTPEDCARLIDANMKLKLGTGILIANPIPKEHAASGSLIDSAIQRALREARDKGITGNAETPFLLGRVNELTGGASLSSNIALVKNNALLGAKISVSLAQMRERDDGGA
ncbi:uncharacterized protein LOC114294287 isoform X1 [Camellia sinensis]|uniref:uncharacterized protein LOC114294287 isoform X1 n=1 Tax=Camellia sinensis TaxID=4442 RepID=UPI001036041C|nr:uncharacterized protein LOC114294287 isoform X1 [Camellia sinensis]